jgi:hypothetical protein
MKANRYFMIMTLCLALACIPAGVFGAEDIACILEKKGPEVEGLITNPSIFRESKLPHLPISQKQIEFLINNPHVALALAHLYSPFLDNYIVKVISDHKIHIDDPGILAGDAELIDACPGKRVYLIAGYFDIFSMRFNGHMLLVTGYSEQRQNTAVSVDATTTAYIKIDSTFARAFAWLVDVLFPKKVDEKIDRLLRAAETIAVAVHKDPKGAYRKLSASGELSAAELREFSQTF